MKKGIFQFLFYQTIFFNLAFSQQIKSELLSVDFVQQKEISQVILSFDNNEFEIKKFHLTEDKQIILEAINVKAGDKGLRSFDTSEFSGSVVMVKPYRQVKDNLVRVAIQLRDNVRSILKRVDNKAVLSLENRFGAFSQGFLDENMSGDEILKLGDQRGLVNTPKSDSVVDILDNLTMSGKKQYIGRRISINVRKVSVSDVLSMIADASGFNLVMNESLKGLPPLTLSLTNTPWDQVLDTVLQINKLIAKKNGSILIVKTLAEEIAEKQEKVLARQETLKEEPLVTKIFPVSFADIAEMEKVLNPYLTPNRGTISKDARTNSIIIKDTVNVIEKAKRIVVALDTQTPQVMIESKIIEVIESHKMNIGLNDGGLKFSHDPFSGGKNAGPGFSFSTAHSVNPFASISIGQLGSLSNIGLNLSLMESENKLKVIQSPKVIAQNNETAEISSTHEILFAKSDAEGNITYEPREAKLELKVTPQVTNDGSIYLKLDVKKEEFRSVTGNAPPPKDAHGVKTNVLVENGSTIVVGGVYKYKESESHSGVPFLKDIPLIGWLFRTSYNPDKEKIEMIVFLTPRIINQEEAGLVAKTES